MRVICVRHGESLANAGGTTDDPLAIPLTELGRSQARAVAATWTAAPTLIATSTATRAIDTAAPTRARFPGVAVEAWPVHEFTYLSPRGCVGTTVHDRKAWVQAYWRRADADHRHGDDAETFAEFIVRVDAALARLAALAPPQRDGVVLFGHGQFINAMRWRLLRPLEARDLGSFYAFNTEHAVANCERVLLDL